MTTKLAGTILTVAAVLIVTLTPALAQEGHEMPGMTPEQMAEMEAYMKAGAVGPQHEELASSAGTYDAENVFTFSGSFNDPIKKGPVTMRMISRWTKPTVQVVEMYGPDREGREVKMMEMTYTKK